MRERQTDRDTERDREIETETDTERQRDRHRERQRQTDRQTERDNPWPRLLFSRSSLINAFSSQMIHINLNTILYAHLEHSPTKTICIRYCMEIHTRTPTRTRSRAITLAETGY